MLTLLRHDAAMASHVYDDTLLMLMLRLFTFFAAAFHADAA